MTERRPRLVLGPGLLLAVIGSALVWWYFHGSQAGPRIVRPSTGPTAPAVAGAPDPDWVVGFDAGLSEDQRRQIRALHDRWRRETADLRQAVERAEQEMAAAASASPVTMQAVGERAAALSALSRELAEARRAWWADASRVLSPDQRARVEAAWKERLKRPGQIRPPD